MASTIPGIVVRKSYRFMCASPLARSAPDLAVATPHAWSGSERARGGAFYPSRAPAGLQTHRCHTGPLPATYRIRRANRFQLSY